MVGTLSRFQCGSMVTKESNTGKKIDNVTTNVKKKDIVLGDIASEIKNLQVIYFTFTFTGYVTNLPYDGGQGCAA